MEQEGSLSFFELNRRLNEMPEFDASTPGSTKRTLYGFAISLFAYCCSFLIQHLPLSAEAEVTALCAVVAVEIIGVSMVAWYSRSEFRGVSSPVVNFAKQLDHDLPHHFELIAWLQSQPQHTLERHASMARFRKERFTQKLPLIAGSIPTLGLVPVAVALYFQIRELAAGRHPGIVDFVAGFIIVLLYFISWVSALMKSRLEGMEMYLQTALEAKQEETDMAARSRTSPQPHHHAH